MPGSLLRRPSIGRCSAPSRSSLPAAPSGAPAGLHLDRACAPAFHGSYRRNGHSKISPIRVSTLPGELRRFHFRVSSMRRLWVTILAVLIASSAIAGCSQGGPRRGTVLGIFVEVGGPVPIEGGRPAPNKPIPVPGRLVARDQSGPSFAVKVGKSGRFRMVLPPGTYLLTGYTPFAQGLPCTRPGAVKVRPGNQATHIEVICPLS